jgi:hypothetical protein
MAKMDKAKVKKPKMMRGGKKTKMQKKGMGKKLSMQKKGGMKVENFQDMMYKKFGGKT